MGITEVRAEESRKIRWSYSAFQLKYERKVESKIQNITIRMQSFAPRKGSTSPRSLVVDRERVVGRAQVRPFLRDGVRVLDVGHILGEDDCEARLKVEIDVAMEEPRPGVVRLEADSDVVTVVGDARRDGVAPDGVVVVVLGRARAAYNCEGVLEEGALALGFSFEEQRPVGLAPCRWKG